MCDEVHALVEARIVALKLRADETLTLVARGDGAKYEEDWKAQMPRISGQGGDLLSQARDDAADAVVRDQVASAIDNSRAWQDSHRRLRELDNGGQYDEAVKLAIGTDQKGSAVAFNELDENLSSAIQKGREKFVEGTSSAQNALGGLVPGVAVLALIGAGGAFFGIRQRLREYR